MFEVYDAGDTDLTSASDFRDDSFADAGAYASARARYL